ncbi:hypothetical protein KQ296_02920 [Synechococcus sp. CS-197]|nr:hypothetical protein [Synechococcus sp. CS-197]
MMLAASQPWLLAYNRISHGVVLSLVGITVLALLVIAIRDTHPPTRSEPPLQRRLVQWMRQHPLVSVLFAAYTAAMVHGTNWFYPELPDLMQGIVHSPLIDNFQLQERFIAETMQRNSFRFFPLAHQDLHALSWFTPYVTVWMLASAAELISIVVVSATIVQELAGPPRRQELLLVMALLFLFAPATGWGFFQLIYCERLLTCLLAWFAFFYLRFQRHGQRRDGALTLALALVAVFVKDIAVLLIVTPALVRWITKPQARQWRSLEMGLIALLPVVAVSYGVLSLLPSLMAQAGAFSSDGRWSLDADWRLLTLAGFSGLRLQAVVRERLQANLLDGLNLAALIYASALWASVGYPYASFWTLPVQLITVMDLGMIWCWVTARLRQHLGATAVSAVGLSASLLILGLEHRASDTFIKRVSRIKTTQWRWHKTYSAMKALSRATREQGDAVNVIFMRSYFNQHTLQGIKADRLIEYHRKRKTYTVVDGRDRGQIYQPSRGDYLLIIDKRQRSDLGQDGEAFEEIARHGESRRGGQIFRHR